MISRTIRFVVFALTLVVLTALTQVGGVVLLVMWLVTRIFAAGWVGTKGKTYRFAARGLSGRGRALITTLLFIVVYAALTIFIIPPLAAMQGRVPLPCSSADPPMQAATPIACAFNRHYVDARMVPLVSNLARAMNRRFPGTITVYLDAGFPFLNGFPLLPHLSHNDGRKLDLAYYYKNPAAKYVAGVLRSPIGYWAFEQPGAADTLLCPNESWLSLRWNMTALQPLWRDLTLEPARTQAALQWIVTEGQKFGVERVFIEPYLAKRLAVTSPLIGFQGCRAARHDDHIHVQIK